MPQRRSTTFQAFTLATLLCDVGANAFAADEAPEEPQKESLRSRLTDPEDGKFDASKLLASAYGFVPIATIITDPAVGYGGGLGLIFIQPGERGSKRPDLSMVGGFATENGSWGAGVGDSRNWRGDTLKTLFAGFYASVNLDFYGFEPVNGQPLEYNLETAGAMGEGRVKIGDSPAWVGLRYMLADVTARFANDITVPGTVPDDSQRLSGLTPLVSYDTRDNLFTPTRGVYGEASVAVFDKALGSDSDFQRVGLTGVWYGPIGEAITLGVKADLAASFDDVPFYLRPSAQLRGLQSLSLQGENIADIEAELRWQASTRWSWVAFAGAGAAWKGLTDFDNSRDAVTGGVGIRYLAARLFGLHMGFDVAFGPEDPIIYFQFGSAWFRP